MKKKHLALLGLVAIIVILILGKTGIINMGSAEDASFKDDIAKYEVKKTDIVKVDDKSYAVILLSCENISETETVPWENSSFVVEQDGEVRVMPLERVMEYNDKFGNEKAFNEAKVKIKPGEKTDIELVYKIRFDDSPIYIRGISNGNNFEYAIK